MKRSEINRLVRAAEDCFREHHRALPPRPSWDVTDFSLGDWRQHGLVLVNPANDDPNDNFFLDPDVGPFPHVIEDEPRTVQLVSDPD
jgi:D-lyxose ketol-isomerase